MTGREPKKKQWQWSYRSSQMHLLEAINFGLSAAAGRWPPSSRNLAKSTSYSSSGLEIKVGFELLLRPFSLADQRLPPETRTHLCPQEESVEFNLWELRLCGWETDWGLPWRLTEYLFLATNRPGPAWLRRHRKARTPRSAVWFLLDTPKWKNLALARRITVNTKSSSQQIYLQSFTIQMSCGVAEMIWNQPCHCGEASLVIKKGTAGVKYDERVNCRSVTR